MQLRRSIGPLCCIVALAEPPTSIAAVCSGVSRRASLTVRLSEWAISVPRRAHLGRLGTWRR